MLTILVAALVPPAPSQDPAEVLAAFVASVNTHDVEAALSSLHEDFEFRDEEATFVVNRAAARSMLGWDAAVGADSSYEVVAVGEDSITVTLVERNEFLRALGIERLRHRVRYETESGLLRAIVMLDASAVGTTVAKGLEPLIEWAGAHRGQLLARVTSDGSPIYTGESAPVWLQLAAEARAAGVLQ